MEFLADEELARDAPVMILYSVLSKPGFLLSDWAVPYDVKPV